MNVCVATCMYSLCTYYNVWPHVCNYNIVDYLLFILFYFTGTLTVRVHLLSQVTFFQFPLQMDVMAKVLCLPLPVLKRL